MFSDKNGYLVLQSNAPMFAIVGGEADANNAAAAEANRTRTPIGVWSKLPIIIKDKIQDKAIAGDVRVEIPKWSDPNYG